MWARESFCIKDENIEVRSFTISESDEMVAKTYMPDSWFERVCNHDTLEKAQLSWANYIKNIPCLPICFSVDGEIAGVTSFHRFDVRAKIFEIGRTSILHKFRRSRVNTQVKRMLMEYGFEKLGAYRIEYRVNFINYTSQMAMLRLGAKFEGVLRETFVYSPENRQNSHLYSVIKTEWPEIKNRLLNLENQRPVNCPVFSDEYESPRFVIKHHKLSAANRLFELVKRNYEGFLDDFPGLCAMKTENEFKGFIAEQAHQAAQGLTFTYGVWDKKSDLLVGQFTIKKIDWINSNCEMGYFFDKEFQSKGHGTEILEVLLPQIQNNGIKRVSVRVFPDNRKSIGLAEKFGFQKEGVLRSAFMTGRGVLADVLLLSKVF